jgi:hypothetical protein
MRRVRSAAVLIVCLVVGLAGKMLAGEPPYTEGSVMNVTFIRTKSGGDEKYMQFLATQWKSLMEAAKKDGLILSYHVYGAPAANRDDWNLMLTAEYKNMAAFDGLETKFRALMEKQAGSIEKAEEQAGKREEIREVFGEKLLRELILK